MPNERSPSPSDAMGRRSFLARAGAAVALPAVALPAFLPRAVSASPAETVVTAHVGIGGRGGSLLRMFSDQPTVRVGALADVDADHLRRAKDAAAGADATGDFRRLLERKDIDAVVVATPDHWHAGVTIAACRAGKDVYVEKPTSTHIADGRAMVTAAREEERVVQVGIHHRSASYNREISRIIRGGRIGKVYMVRNWMWTNPQKPRSAFQKPPETLDWDFWLGPAPDAPYHADRVHFNFRWCRDYAGGYMTDWGVHMFNMITCAMDVDHMGPSSVEAHGEFVPDNLYDHPARMEARWEYRNPDFVLTWSQPESGGDILPGQKYGTTYYGEDGQLRTGFGDDLIKFYRDGKEEPLPREGRAVDVPESPGHIDDFLACIRSRERPIADVEIGHRTTLTCLLANIALFSGKGRLDWDWKKEQFRDEEANAWLRGTPRAKYAI